MRNPQMDRFRLTPERQGRLVKFDGLYYSAELLPSNAHDLWLWPAYARSPHQVIDSDRADRGGRRVVRIDDRDADGQAALARIEVE